RQVRQPTNGGGADQVWLGLHQESVRVAKPCPTGVDGAITTLVCGWYVERPTRLGGRWGGRSRAGQLPGWGKGPTERPDRWGWKHDCQRHHFGSGLWSRVRRVGEEAHARNPGRVEQVGPPERRINWPSEP